MTTRHLFAKCTTAFRTWQLGGHQATDWKTNNAKPFPDGNYIAIAHPKTIYDIQGDTAWVNAQQYAGSGNIIEGEAGKMYGVRFIETSNAKIFTGAGSGGIDVHGTLIMGADAYVVADLEGAGVVRKRYCAAA